MLTHDIEPVIDSVKVLHREFKDQTNANFIGSKKGVLKEQDIKKDDILTFSQIFQSILDNENVDEISKLVYMRRNFEILNDKGNGYQVFQIFRIINGEFTKNDDFSDVFKKFINETYHIENDFIHQLNPQKYDLIPEFIIEECDEFIEGLSN